MPTGLTHKIYEGQELTIREFALNCARQLSPAYYATDRATKEMPMDRPPVLKPDDYKRKSIQRDKERLERALWLKEHPEELRKLFEAWQTKGKIERMEENIRREKTRKRYNDFIAMVEQWQVPDAYQSLKSFMLKQLTESRDFDAPISINRYDYEYSCTMEEWNDAEINSARRGIEMYEEDIKKEEKWIREGNEYLKGLYDLLDEISPYNMNEL